MAPRDLYRILAAAVAPRPICFAATVDAAGRANLSPYSFFNVVSVDPPLLAFSPLLGGRNGGRRKDTLNNVLAVPEVSINVVEYDFVERMNQTSAAYPPGVNEFTEAGLTEAPSQTIRPPRVAESRVSFECTVDRVLHLGDGPLAGNLVLARIQHVHLHPDLLDADGELDPARLDLVGRLGGSDYVRATAAARFALTKPGYSPPGSGD